jgi:hypothetical protein
VRGHDRALHQDVPFPGKRIGVLDSGFGGEYFDIAADISQVADRRLMDRIVPVAYLDHRGEE